jgi:tetratricopeptide (TPR) repeat protein
MGKVYLCQGHLAKQPLFVHSAGIHLYSAEELCYFLVNYLSVVDESFFNAEFFEFITTQLKMENLAKELTKYNPSTQLPQMILFTVQSCGYLSVVELRKFKEGLRLKSEAKPWEVIKSRADFLASEGHHYKALELYQSILKEQNEEVSSDFLGRVYFNKAMSHWQLFEFEKALRAMEMAYRLLKNTEAMKNWYFLHLQNPQIKIGKELLEGIGSENQKKWKEEWKQQEREVDEVVAQMSFADRESILEKWKEEYRQMRE